MVVADDAIEAHDFASHLKTRDLVAPIVCHHAGLEKSSANRIQAAEFFPIAKQGGAPFYFAPQGNYVINTL